MCPNNDVKMRMNKKSGIFIEAVSDEIHVHVHSHYPLFIIITYTCTCISTPSIVIVGLIILPLYNLCGGLIRL